MGLKETTIIVIRVQCVKAALEEGIRCHTTTSQKGPTWD